MVLPEVGGELKRYNADLKLIVLLRDPVERALSAYYAAELFDHHDATMDAFWGSWACRRRSRSGEAARRPHRVTRALLRLSYAAEFRRLRRLGIAVT